MSEIRFDWSYEDIKKLYDMPLLELVYQAANMHRRYFEAGRVQVSQLLSIKTGGCPEDCSYCPQAARYNTGLKRQKLMDVPKVMEAACKAKEDGASRMCLGAAWREVRGGTKDFEKVLEMVQGITDLGMEVCCTLGMLGQEEADQLKKAGLYAYNHNIDSSSDHYKTIISTRQYSDRLKTLGHVRKAGLSVCCGGIIGLGEKKEDRIEMLRTLSSMKPHPESVPINTLVAVPGTPLEEEKPVPTLELVRMIACARLVLPASYIRLSAGRKGRSSEDQALCFLAGANSIFAGEKLLTTSNPQPDEDQAMFDLLGLTPTQSFEQPHVQEYPS